MWCSPKIFLVAMSAVFLHASEYNQRGNFHPGNHHRCSPKGINQHCRLSTISFSNQACVGLDLVFRKKGDGLDYRYRWWHACNGGPHLLFWSYFFVLPKAGTIGPIRWGVNPGICWDVRQYGESVPELFRITSYTHSDLQAAYTAPLLLDSKGSSPSLIGVRHCSGSPSQQFSISCASESPGLCHGDSGAGYPSFPCDRCTFQWAANLSKCFSLCPVRSAGREWRTRTDFLCLADCDPSDEKQSILVWRAPSAFETTEFWVFIWTFWFGVFSLLLYGISLCANCKAFVGLLRHLKRRALTFYPAAKRHLFPTYPPSVYDIARGARLKRARLWFQIASHPCAFVIAIDVFMTVTLHEDQQAGCFSCYNAIFHPTALTDRLELSGVIQESPIVPAVIVQCLCFLFLVTPAKFTHRSLNIINGLFALIWCYKAYIFGEKIYSVHSIWFLPARMLQAVAVGNFRMTAPLFVLVSCFQVVVIFVDHPPRIERREFRVVVEIITCCISCFCFWFLDRWDLHCAKATLEKFRDRRALSLASSLLDAFCEAVVHLGGDLSFAQPSPRLASLLLHRSTAAHTSKHSFASLLSPKDRDRFEAGLIAQSRQGQGAPSFVLHVDLVDASKCLVPVQLTSAYVQDEDGNGCYALGVTEEGEKRLADAMPDLCHDRAGRQIGPGMVSGGGPLAWSESGGLELGGEHSLAASGVSSASSDPPESYNADEGEVMEADCTLGCEILNATPSFQRMFFPYMRGKRTKPLEAMPQSVVGRSLKNILISLPRIQQYLFACDREMRSGTMTPPVWTNSFDEVISLKTRSRAYLLDATVVWCFNVPDAQGQSRITLRIVSLQRRRAHGTPSCPPAAPLDMSDMSSAATFADDVRVQLWDANGMTSRVQVKARADSFFLVDDVEALVSAQFTSCFKITHATRKFNNFFQANVVGRSLEACFPEGHGFADVADLDEKVDRGELVLPVVSNARRCVVDRTAFANHGESDSQKRHHGCPKHYHVELVWVISREMSSGQIVFHVTFNSWKRKGNIWQPQHDFSEIPTGLEATGPMPSTLGCRLKL